MRRDTEIRQTQPVREALALAERLIATAGPPIGEITGETGTGKSWAALAVARKCGALRLAAWEGITRFQLTRALCAAAGIVGPSTRHLDLLAEWAGAQDERPLVVVDEANKLDWRALEVLRWLADEAGFAVLLVGTELYERRFADARTRPLLLQLGRRIGAKRVAMRRLAAAELVAHVLRPAFGDEVDRDLARRFWQSARRGVWGDAVELAEECRRLMAVNETARLTEAVLEAAVAWSANARAVDGVRRPAAPEAAEAEARRAAA